MGYLRSLFLVLTIAVQLVTLSYVLVVMGNTQAFDDNRSIVNTTDARAVYYLGTVALIMTAGLAVTLWLERRGPSRRVRADSTQTVVADPDPEDRNGTGSGAPTSS